MGVVILADRDWPVLREESAGSELGFDRAWTYDHLILGRGPEAPFQAAVPVLAAAAVSTQRVGLGTLMATPSGLRRLLVTGTRIRGDLDSQAAFEDVAGVAAELGFTDLAAH